MNKICLICGSETIQNSNFTLKCKKCYFYISNLKPGFGAPIEGIDDVRLDNFKKILELLKNEIKNDSKVLEIGPGKGLFIKLLTSKKIDISGIEPGLEESKRLIKEGYKIFNYEFPLKNLSTIGKYDFIIFNDVIEHIPASKLKETVKQCHSLLNKNGYLVINIPSSDGFFFKLSNILKFLKIDIFYERLWQKNLSSPHMVYFNSKNLNTFIKNNQFEIYKESSLRSIGINSKKRISHSIKNFFLQNVISLTLMLVYYFLKFLPQDVILKIYKKI